MSTQNPAAASETSTPSGGARQRFSWPLRQRLVLLVVVVVFVIASAVSAVALVTLKNSGLDQLDARLVASAERGARPPGGIDWSEGTIGLPDAGVNTRGIPPILDGEGGPRPPGLSQPGLLDVGAISVHRNANNGAVYAGFFNDQGSFTPLTDSQQNSLLSLAQTNAEPVSLTIPGLGDFRALVSVQEDGSVSGVALPMDSIKSTQNAVLWAAVAATAAGVIITLVVGGVLVRRELRGLTEVARTASAVTALPLDQGKVSLRERVVVDPRDVRTEVGQVGTALNRLLGHVEQSLEAREATAQSLRRFLADASHELRTPLASIRGHAELAQRITTELPEDVVRAIARVESESVRMSALVEDLLLLIRLDEAPELLQGEVDVSEIIVDSVSDAHAASPGHNWQIDFGAEVDEPFVVLGDENRVRQIVTNLLANARTHTPEGTTVKVSAARRQDANQQDWVDISVHDDGPGIPEAMRDVLFDRFTRGDAAREYVNGSTGLGLSIVRALVAAHGGSLTYESEPGRTVFVVTLPAFPADLAL